MCPFMIAQTLARKKGFQTIFASRHVYSSGSTGELNHLEFPSYIYTSVQKCTNVNYKVIIYMKSLIQQLKIRPEMIKLKSWDF